MFDRSRMIVVVALVAAVLSVSAAPAFGWSTLTRLTTATAPSMGALAVGAFVQPDDSFLLSGWTDSHFTTAQSGFSTGVAGGMFSAPSGPLVSDAVWLPGGGSLVGTFGNIQLRAADGSLVGSPQSVAATGLGVDSSGDATAAGVVDNGSYQLIVSTRPAAGPSFTAAAAPVATSASPMSMDGLVVDPNGAAVVTWLVGTTLYQATRPAGVSASFGAPATLAANADGAESMASNAAGRAVLDYYDGTGFSAAIRAPGGAFGTPADITGPVSTPVFPSSATAVTSDGSAAILVENSTPVAVCGVLGGLQAYRLAAGASSWTSAGTFGGTQGNSIAGPALAGGPAGRIDAAWTVDLRSAGEECGATDPYEIQTGTLGSSMTTIFSENPPPLSGGSYGNAHTAQFAIEMALNSCGDGALIVGINDGGFNGSANSDLHNGLFTSTTHGCPAAAAPGAPGGVTAVAGHGAATVRFTAPAAHGSPITGYTVTASPGGAHATGSASPITVTGLTNGTAYAFKVTATNAIGTGPPSAASNPVTPTRPRTSVVHVVMISGRAGGLTVKLSCSGGASACPAARVTATVTEHITRGKVTGVSASGGRRAPAARKKVVVIARARASLSSGASKTLSPALNATGTALLTKYHHFLTVVTVASTGIKPVIATVKVTA